MPSERPITALSGGRDDSALPALELRDRPVLAPPDGVAEEHRRAPDPELLLHPLPVRLDRAHAQAQGLGDVARGVLPFLALLLLTAMILYIWPDLALYIPFKW